MKPTILLIVDAFTGTSEISCGLGAILTQRDENGKEKDLTVKWLTIRSG